MTDLQSCTACGERNQFVLEHPAHHAKLCPTCAAEHAESDAAREHLNDLLRPAVMAWARHWQAVGVERDMLEVMANSVCELQNGPQQWVQTAFKRDQ
jgi:recombinational DNA repair protein (RecF pathway)